MITNITLLTSAGWQVTPSDGMRVPVAVRLVALTNRELLHSVHFTYFIAPLQVDRPYVIQFKCRIRSCFTVYICFVFD